MKFKSGWKFLATLRCAFSVAATASLALGLPGHRAAAYLGGFENVDGYSAFFNDVANYNAGQFGPNAGGGVYSPLPPNTGLWSKLQGPLFPAVGSTGNFAYATGHQNFDRVAPSTAAQALVITTNSDGWGAGPQEYAYDLDTFDLGVAPAATAGQIVTMSFWECSQMPGTGEGGGLGPGTMGNIISFLDSSSNVGFAVGYHQPGTTSDFAAINVAGSWQLSAVPVTPGTYHRWDVTLNLAAQTVSIDIFNGVLTNLATNAPLGAAMSNLTEMRFLSTPGVVNAKVWSVDDFRFMVPEPTGIGGILLAFGFGIRSLHRRKILNPSLAIYFNSIPATHEVMTMQRGKFTAAFGVLALALASTGLAFPIQVTHQPITPSCDVLSIPINVDEIGHVGAFPIGERLESTSNPNGPAVCPPFNNPNLLDPVVRMRNLNTVTFRNVWYVADKETDISNLDGLAEDALPGIPPSHESFRIDNMFSDPNGSHHPLLQESLIADGLWQPNEVWAFVLQDYRNSLGLPPESFTSLHVGSASMNIATLVPSSGSIIAIAVPEPSGLLVLLSALVSWGAWRRR